IGTSYWSGVQKLLLNFVVIRFLLLVFFAGIGGSFLNNYLLLYMNSIHASKALMGIALTVATVSEVPMWFFSDRFIRKLGARGTLILGLITFGFRAILYSVIQASWMVLPVQLLHGVTFSITYAAGVTYASELAPEGLGATAQGLFTGTMMGLGGATGALIGGYLFDRVGGAVMFQWAGIAILIFGLLDLGSQVYERNSARRKIAYKEME
ncbi:MAG: MFS transporter, partial [Omnitrophica WOR_2 bacterium]